MKKLYWIGGLLLLALLVVLLTSWTELSKLDIAKVPGRAAWQLPERVVESLGLEPGDQVADIGAGDGYFTFFLADAVGPTGRVYAVEVEKEKTRELEETVREKGYSNIVVVLAELTDPLLPDGEIDLVFLCNTYHHIEDREAYFSRLVGDLRADGRVAVVDVRAVQRGLARLFTDPDHSTPVGEMHEEMAAAGYRMSESYIFLPVQSFEIFAPVPGAPRSTADPPS